MIEKTMKIKYINKDSNKELEVDVDKKMIFIYGKNGTGKTTLSKSKDLNPKLVFNEDFIHNNVYIIDSDGAKVDSGVKSNFSELLIGEDVIKLKKEQIDFEKLLKDASTIKKEIDVVINGLFYKNQIDIEYNPIKDKIDDDFAYDMEKTIDEQLEQYKSSFELEQKIETDEMLNNYVCQIKKQESLKDLIDKINQDCLLKEFIFTDYVEQKEIINERLRKISENIENIKNLEQLALKKNVDKANFQLIKGIVKLHDEVNAKKCIICGNENFSTGIDEWKKILLDTNVEQKEQLKCYLNKLLDNTTKITESREMYEKVAPKTIKNIDKFILEIKEVLKSIDIGKIMFLDLNDKETEDLTTDLDDKLKQIANYLVKNYKNKIIFLNSLINFINKKITEKKKEIEEKLSANADEHTKSINEILTKLGLDKEIKVKIDRAAGQIKYSLIVPSGDISKLSDGQKHKVALAVFLNSIKRFDLTNKIIMFDDPMIAMDEYTYHLFKSYLVNEVMTNDDNCPNLIIATHNFSYLYIQISNILTSPIIQERTKILKLYSDKIKEMNIELFKLDDLALFKKAVDNIEYNQQLIDLSCLYNKIFREFLDLKMRLLGNPLNGNPKEEIEALGLEEKLCEKLKRNHSILCSCVKDPNPTLEKAKMAFNSLVQTIEELGFDYITTEELEKVNKLNNDRENYEKKDIDIIISEIAEILRNDKIEQKYKDYINHPRISFTKNTLSTSMDV